MSSNRLTSAAFLFLVLIWGTTWAAIRVGLEGIPPFTGAALRFGLASAALTLLALWRGVPLGGDRRVWAVGVANATLSFAGSYGIVYWAEQYLPSGLTSILFATFTFWVALLAHFMLPEERLRLPGLLGILLGFGGVAIIFSADLEGIGGPMMGTAAAVMVLSPICAAVANVAVKRWGQGIHPLTLTAVPTGAAAGALGAIAGLRGEGQVELHLTPLTVGSVLYLGLVGTAVTFTLYFWILERMPATRLALIAYLTPLVAVALGTLLFGEPFTARTALGSAGVLAGVALVARS